MTGGDSVELGLYGIAAMASVEVCGAKQADSKVAMVPHACLVHSEMLLTPVEPIDSKPVPIVVRSVVGAEHKFERPLKPGGRRLRSTGEETRGPDPPPPVPAW